MSQTRKKKRKVRGKVKFKQSARLVHKNDATRVDKPDTIGVRKAPAKLYPDNGANFKVKIRRK